MVSQMSNSDHLKALFISCEMLIIEKLMGQMLQQIPTESCKTKNSIGTEVFKT